MSSEKFDLDAALADEATPKGLRDWAAKQAADNKKLADELAEFRKAKRSTDLASVFKDAGVSDKLTRFYPSDAGTDGESVGKWLKENADVFGVAQKPADDVTPPAADGGTDDLQAAIRAMQQATPAGGGSTPDLDDMAGKIDRLDMKTPEGRAGLDEFQRTLMQMAAQNQANHLSAMSRR